MTRIDGRLLSDGPPTNWSGAARAGSRWPASAIELTPSVVVVLPQPLLGQPGRPRWAALRGARPPHRGSRACGNGCCSACRDPRGLLLLDPSGRAASGKGAILLPDGSSRSRTSSTNSRSTRATAGARGTYALTDAEGRERAYDVREPRLGVLPGRGVLRRLRRPPRPGRLPRRLHVEGEVWDVTHPTQIIDAAGNGFEFDHDWAESFVRLRPEDESGLAHFECVVVPRARSSGMTQRGESAESTVGRPSGRHHRRGERHRRGNRPTVRRGGRRVRARRHPGRGRAGACPRSSGDAATFVRAGCVRRG